MNSRRVYLLDKDGNVQYGLNWGRRDNRDPNQSYLQLESDVYNTDFFPIKGTYFLVTTDEGECFALNRAQKTESGTALQSPENNSIIGIFLRKRLGVPSGAEITKEAILNYGRIDILFTKIDNRHFLLDFSKKWTSDDFAFVYQSYLTIYKNDIDYKRIIKLAKDVSENRELDSPYLDEFKLSTYFNEHYTSSPLPLQRIFYGAPGTGKSNTIKREVEDKGRVHFRTTFHPDSDYSTFVGCYKPTMVEAPVRDGSGHEVANAKPEEKNRISYSFVPQAFAKAYCEAWNKYDGSENAEPVFLIIEEINRGNCAQIFGDIFQLLDREMEGARCGFSTYPIDADEDLKAFLEDGVKRDGTPWLTNKEGINDGKLCLPPNLYIWATMNTSDQSLFPIDSAFKRRWDWKYVPIDTKKENWTIKIGDKDYSWSSFLEKINEEIDRTTHSEDKMLGFYFCRANNGVIDADKFVSKVLFYIYNDVFKDYGFDREMFKDEDGKVISFKSYYNTDGTINESKVERFLDNLTKDKE